MLKIENVQVAGFEPAFRGMRNPKNSWHLSDSVFKDADGEGWHNLNHDIFAERVTDNELYPCGADLGVADIKLAKTLCAGGPTHAKFRRMIIVWLDITAPLYWWKEFDTYKVGTVRDSCSTMHKIMSKEFEVDDFSFENLGVTYKDEEGYENYLNLWVDGTMRTILRDINQARYKWLREKDPVIRKKLWWQVIQLLPSSYNQRSTVMVNYEALQKMYHERKDHKLDEWHDYCHFIEYLPYFRELIL